MQKPGWNSSLLTTLLTVLPACGDPSSGVTEPGSQTDNAALSTPLPQAPSTSSAHGTTRIIVRYRDHAAARNTPSAAMAASRLVQETATRQGFHAQHLRTTGQGAQVWAMNRRMTEGEAQALAKQIAAADPEVEYAEPDALLSATKTPNDPYYPIQWHYSEPTAGINLPLAWDRTNGAGVVVAVVDTGYRPHADLSANLLAGYDFVSQDISNDGNGRDSDARDPGDWCDAQGTPSSWHGTHVAGTIAAVTNNGLGVAGVAYGAKILPVRVLGTCSGYISDIADGILWASGNPVTGVPTNTTPARVINLSLWAPAPCVQTQTLQEAITAARSRGAVVIAAAGNANANAANATPASCRGVVAVSSVGRTAQKSWFSNYGFTVALSAPGESIMSTINTGTTVPASDDYGFQDGTSMAAPHVAGVAALMLSANPSLTTDVVTRVLQATTKPTGACSGCGTGIVNAAVAVNEAIASGSANHIQESAFFVQQLYYDVLRRKPDASGEAAYVGVLNGCNGNANCLASTRAAIARNFLESAEYRGQDPFDTASPAYNLYFVDRCYWRFLQRSAKYNPEGKFWEDYLNATGDYTGVVHSFITSPEYRSRFGAP
jgi:serine protease